MKFDILTIFPNIVSAYTTESILKRAQEAGVIDIKVHDLRDWAGDKHKKVDDKPYGGGPGMVMRADVISRAVDNIRAGAGELGGRPVEKKTNTQNLTPKTRVILFSPAGKKFTQDDAKRYATGYTQIIMICGRYEGVDARVAEAVADEVVSIGDYVLSGGEIPAMVVTEATARLVPGVLGKEESEESRRLGVGVPQYTKPDVIEIDGKEYTVPDVLKSGHHSEIEKWRKEQQKGLDK